MGERHRHGFGRPPNRANDSAMKLLVLLSPLLFAAASLLGTPVEEIREVLRAQQQAWNRGDIDGFMNGYARTRSTTFVSDDTIRRGWETVRARYREKYSDRAKMGVLTFSEPEITLLSPNAAVVLGRWSLKRAKDQ